MGVSITLLEKDQFVLSVEVDRDVQLEISTGFTGPRSTHFGVGIKVSPEELDEVIVKLQEFSQQLKEAWTCECTTVNHKDWTECSACERPKPDEILKDHLTS